MYAIVQETFVDAIEDQRESRRREGLVAGRDFQRARFIRILLDLYSSDEIVNGVLGQTFKITREEINEILAGKTDKSEPL